MPLDDDPESAASGSSRVRGRSSGASPPRSLGILGEVRAKGRLGIVAAVLLLACVAGCGGGSSSSSTGRSTASQEGAVERTRPAKGAWAEQADTICRANKEANEAALEEMQALFGPGVNAPKALKEAARFVREGVRRVEAEVGSFARVTPPASLESSFEAMIGQIEAIAAIETQVARALESESAGELKGLTVSLVHHELRIHTIADRLGLPDCGRIVRLPGLQTIT